MKGYQEHLKDDEVTWAVVDPDELSDSARDHLAQCDLCTGKVQALEMNLDKLGEIANRWVPMAPPRPIFDKKIPARGFLGIGWGTLGLSATVAGILLMIIFGGIMVNRYSKYGEIAGVREEINKDALFMAEVDELIENPLPSLYMELSGEDSPMIDKGFMDFVVPEVSAGKQEPGSA